MTVRNWGEDIINREAMDTYTDDTQSRTNVNEKKSNHKHQEYVNTHAPNEWRLNVMNVATEPSEPVVLIEWKISFYGCRL